MSLAPSIGSKGGANVIWGDSIFVFEKRRFGQVRTATSLDNLNSDTYKMDRRKGRKRKHPFFRAC
jgi:hypothetical protein